MPDEKKSWHREDYANAAAAAWGFVTTHPMPFLVAVGVVAGLVLGYRFFA